MPSRYYDEPVRRRKKKLQTSKVLVVMLMLTMLLMCLVVCGFSMFAMYVLNDLSSLSTLIQCVIGTFIAEVMALIAYMVKAYFETKQEELIKLEREKLEKEGAVG